MFSEPTKIICKRTNFAGNRHFLRKRKVEKLKALRPEIKHFHVHKNCYFPVKFVVRKNKTKDNLYLYNIGPGSGYLSLS